MTQPVCGATTTKGKPCRKPAILGGRVCTVHGGLAPQVRAAAARRLAEQRARGLLSALGEDVPPVVDPFAALEQIAGQAVALVEVLRPIVGSLSDVRARGGLGAVVVAPELQVYIAALGRAESVLSKIVSLGLDERRTRIAEAQVDLVLAAIGRALDRLEMSDDDQQRARVLIAEEFRRQQQPALGSGGAR